MSESNENSLQKQLESLTQKTNADTNYNMTKALVNWVPYVGSLVGGFYDTHIQDPFTLRLKNFLESIVQELERLKYQTNAVDTANPAVHSTLIQACKIVVHQHKEEKLEALKNVILNSALPNSDDELFSRFLHLIDEFTVRHLVLLKLLDQLKNFTVESFSEKLKDLEDNKDFYNQALKDLSAKGLIELRSRYPVMEQEKSPEVLEYEAMIQLNFNDYPMSTRRKTAKENRFESFAQKREENMDSILDSLKYGYQENKTTKLGRKFVEFIESPLNVSQPDS